MRETGDAGVRWTRLVEPGPRRGGEDLRGQGRLEGRAGRRACLGAELGLALEAEQGGGEAELGV